MGMSLAEIEAMISALPVADQARLLEFLAPRVTDAVRSAGNDGTNGNGSGKTSAPDAWREFRAVGDRLAALPRVPGEPSLTQLVTESRR